MYFIKKPLHNSIFNNTGQVFVEYLLLVALVFTMLVMFNIVFQPTKQKMLSGLKESLQSMVSNGSPKVGHPIEEKRVVEIK